MTRGAFKHNPVSHEVAVRIRSSHWIFHCCHVFEIEDDSPLARGTLNLIDDVSDSIAVSEHAAFVDVPTHERTSATIGGSRSSARFSLMVLSCRSVKVPIATVGTRTLAVA